MTTHNLLAISPLDGRYAAKLANLNELVSEHALFKYRLTVEIHWLLALCALPEFNIQLAAEDQKFLLNIIDNYDVKQSEQVKKIEQETNHDVKALEYYIKQKMSERTSLESALPYVHFAATSEDINNLAYSLMHKNTLNDVIIPSIEKLISELTQLATANKGLAMLARTHGQAASPTTLGKEITVFAKRLQSQLSSLQHIPIQGKFNGAVGNFNAHHITYPEIDWPQVSCSLVNKLGLSYNACTTQIEPHDRLAESLHALSRINTILIDLSRDIWSYISLGYFKQHKVEQEVGSSTMPHKVNPIDFENAEGNLGVANALAQHLANKLPISRWQRDLSDSTVLRNLGSVCAYSLLAYQSLHKGLTKISPCEERIQQDLTAHPAILAEAIQTVLKCHGISDAYEQLKQLTRGETITLQTLQEFIKSLDLPTDVKQKLQELTPQTYLGLSEQLCD